jgi:hypothetical protein
MVNQESISPPASPSPPPRKSKELSTRKKELFAFFDAHGGPLTPEYRAARRALRFPKNIFFNWNWLAFFFGPIYFYACGMKKKGTVILVGYLAYLGTETALGVPKEYHPFGAVACLIIMWSANYSRYLKVVKGVEGWNPYERFTKRPL